MADRSRRRWACILGQPVRYSLSPRLHNAAFAAVGLDASYEAREVAPEELGQAIEAMRMRGFLGANVTAPHKAAACQLMDEVSAEARALGVINTIVPRDGQLLGDNTDAAGLAAWLRREGIDARGAEAVVLGAGGAARATVMALGQLGARSARVLNRTPERAEMLVYDLQPHVGDLRLSWGALEEAATPRVEPARLVVNATSLGHHGSAPSVDASWYSPESVAIELVYNPPETAFLTAARAAGARAENGLGMLVHQAALAFERWTGERAPLEVYWAAAREAQP
jgi:shikimate dehydrogenase